MTGGEKNWQPWHWCLPRFNIQRFQFRRCVFHRCSEMLQLGVADVAADVQAVAERVLDVYWSGVCWLGESTSFNDRDGFVFKIKLWVKREEAMEKTVCGKNSMFVINDWTKQKTLWLRQKRNTCISITSSTSFMPTGMGSYATPFPSISNSIHKICVLTNFHATK